ncbi:hypothetical protein C0993_002636 [Termitomyces sp. T159_Od127]|nr:hypothetical protein C0993_002636 [Termitomyces sp. T159_Od127]
MARKPVTYARKRNRNIREPVPQTRSSPIDMISNPNEEIATCEMQRRMLKRSRQTCSALTTDRTENAEQLSKKPKLNDQRAYEFPQTVTTVSSILVDQPGLQTPHNTGLTQEQVFKLESSRGGCLQSEEYELSPVPLMLPQAFCNEQILPAHSLDQKYMHKTSSSNLKENAIPSVSKFPLESRPNSYGLACRQNPTEHAAKLKNKTSTQGMLASPFASKPSSPQKLSISTLSSQGESLRGCQSSKRILSDTHFDPNLPLHRTQTLVQAHSTTNSPTLRHEDESVKARRPSAPCATSQRPDVAAWFSSYSSATNLHDQILSSSADFFVSCFGSRNLAVDFNRPPSQLSCNFDYDEAFFGDALEISTPIKLKGQRSSGSICLDSPDVVEGLDSDTDLNSRTLHSLNSDTFGSWVTDSLISSPTLSLKSACSLSEEDRNATFELDHDLAKPASLLPLSAVKQLSSPSYVENPESLQDLFTKLDLRIDDGMYCTKQVAVIAANEKRTGRDRRGTIRASDLPVAGSSVLEGPRRTRSGTVVQGSTRPRRERSDTIVARPSNSASSNCPPIPSMRVGDVTMSDNTGEPGRQGVDVMMATTEEQDDELLLKNHWIEEDWVVAAPPSPVLPRRKRKAITEWRRRFEQKKASGIWGMEHDPDNGEDDPLLLK